MSSPAAAPPALRRFNALSDAEAERELLDCCGARRWARAVAVARPFASAEELAVAAERAFDELAPGDWSAAFAAHPRLGAPPASGAQSARAGSWSGHEQAAALAAPAVLAAELAAANRRYEAKFGRTYIACAAGSGAAELLATLEARLGNDAAREREVAAGEQRRITSLRLRRIFQP